ncbi:beta-N-acetylhexosaminidase [Thalassococcus sp. S3]|uniref:beta-N-acetylhexosaminidase n=1 Tax=Thalassococcus sp. S3 TaxID=2017482 RepID=UPI0010244EF9|nr:beta-N-acetylhexosaminidase [Thalassococcus sp. S3]QBF31574.1 beta-N-acetylhexosaminidase [Thalassococcus sp. S3]
MRFGATILDAEGLSLTNEEKALFRDAQPFGFILFARNVDSADQVRALCAEMRDAVGREAPITIDQEGGRVQRLRHPLAREWRPPLDHARGAGAGAERAMYLRYRLIAHELRALGIDSNCAPMVDLAHDATHPFLKNRCYGRDPERVARIGRAVAEAHLDGGVLPIVKHMPGHGRATLDSHYDLPRVQAPVDALEAEDFLPFRALNDLPMGMTAHQVYEAFDDQPATLSPKVMQMIREHIGFDGLIMTDDISMKALSGSLAKISRDALNAGCDVILHCNGNLAERSEVAEAAGEMNDAAQRRAEAALDARRSPADIDIPSLEAQLEALMGGQVYG